MRFRNGLALFTKTNSRRLWNIASYHSPHSLTWRWLIAFSLGGWEARRLWPIWMPYRTNYGLQWVIRLPWIGILRWGQQRPMWYRDLYMRMRDEQDFKSGHLRTSDPLPPIVFPDEASTSVH